jgi:hypothetical protein
MKQHLLMGGERLLNETFDLALKLDATKLAARPAMKLREIWARVPQGNVTSDQVLEDWVIHMPSVWECLSQKRLSAET